MARSFLAPIFNAVGAPTAWAISKLGYAAGYTAGRAGFRRSKMPKGPFAASSGGGMIPSEQSSYVGGVDDETHPDTDFIPDSGKQRRRCTLAYYGNTTVRGIVDSQVRQMWHSFAVQPDSGSAAANALIKDEWARRLDSGLDRVIEQAIRHLLIDGGLVPKRIGSPSSPARFEVVPYRQIKTPFTNQSNPNIRDGFEYGADGEQVACWVEREASSYDSVYATGESVRVPLMSHPTMARLAGQTKGLSWYSAAIVRLEMVNRWLDALLRAAEAHAYLLAIVRSNTDDSSGVANKLSAYNSSASSPTSQTETEELRRIVKFTQKHRVLFMGKGDYKILQTDAPRIAEFLTWCLRSIARALGVSFERLTYDLSLTSFSATKFGDRDDRVTVIDHQNILRRDILVPIHREIVTSLMLRPSARMPSAGRFAADTERFLRVGFQLPGRQPVDELKAEEANALAIKNRTASRGRICASVGTDADEIEREQIEEDRRYFDRRKKLYMDCGMDEEMARDLALEDMRMSLQDKVSSAATSPSGTESDSAERNPAKLPGQDPDDNDTEDETDGDEDEDAA
ncbi:MAG: phage portal protein [Bryobacteraceae bacterium]